MENVSLSTYVQYAPEIAIGLGVVLSLLLVETMGVTAGGLIVPGYIALYLHRPEMVVITFLISILTFSVVRFLSKYMLIYGKRRIAMSLLLGFLLGVVFKWFISQISDPTRESIFTNSILSHKLLEITNYGKDSVIGHIIPGLIASWMDRQGIIRTISTVLMISSIVLLIMMILYRGHIQYV